jgi:glycosyltransferase involved in cell wall biosynthesis
MSVKPRDVVIDMSRLATRFSRPAPNGIDRVDLGYAQHFLSRERAGQAAILGLAGPRAVANRAARQIVAAIAEHWREGGRAEDDHAYQNLGHFLDGSVPNPSSAYRTDAQSNWRVARSLARLLRDEAVLGRDAMFPGRSLAQTVPQDAIYLNVSQFPLWIDGYFRWLDQRPDVKAVFFIHDLLPIEYPEFFPASEAHRHARRLEVLARRAAGIIVASDHTRQAIERYFEANAHPLPPICVCPLPVTESFSSSRAPVLVRRHPYFVSIGTLEPRKNQLFLLNLWREFNDKGDGGEIPRLVLVGARGWDNENVVDMIERCARLRPFVIETGRLSTPALVQIMRGSRAVLMPTFAEGFGLPVAEALASGVRVIASDIQVFREQVVRAPLGLLTVLDPLDGPAWKHAIADHLKVAKSPFQQIAGDAETATYSWVLHLEHVERFLTNIGRCL